MNPHTDKTIPQRLSPWLTLIASFGIPVSATWGLAWRLWSDTTWATVEYIQLLLALSTVLATALAVCVVWIVRHRRKSPKRFQDECTFDSRLGIYRHATKEGFFCGTCTPQGVESPLQKKDHGWLCMLDKNHWHKNPDNPAPTAFAVGGHRGYFSRPQ